MTTKLNQTDNQSEAVDVEEMMERASESAAIEAMQYVQESLDRELSSRSQK